MKQKVWAWIKAAGIRAVRTMAQTAVAMIPVSVSISEVSWKTVLGTAALAGITSMLTSLAGLPELKTDPQAEGHDADGQEARSV